MQQLLDIYVAGMIAVGFLGLGLTTSVYLVAPKDIGAWVFRNMLAITILLTVFWPAVIVLLLIITVRQTTSAF